MDCKTKRDLVKYKKTHVRIQSVNMPRSKILKINDLFDDSSQKIPNMKKLREHLYEEGRLSPDLVLKIIEMVKSIIKCEPNILRLDPPTNIVGDIHGQFYDLLTIFTIGGSPENFRYLFMGDFVDRGQFSFECICYLFSLKIKYPNRIYLIRGNHESRHLTRFFTFKDECLFKSNEAVYENFMQSFDCLPVACILDKKFFCVHGGISPHLNNVNTIESGNRFQEVPKQGLFCDLLWSDPIENFDRQSSKISKDFLYNSIRGCSYNYTYGAVERFLKENSFLCLIRAHQVQREGIRFSRGRQINDSKQRKKTDEFPAMITIFSAPNYCDVYKNKGAIIQYTGNQFDVKLFTESDHPFVLPNFQNAFSWSLPFIIEKLSEILVFFLNQISDEELKNDDEDENEELMLNKFVENVKEKIKLATAEKQSIFKRLNLKKTKIKKCNEIYKKSNELTNSDLKLGSLTPTNRLRRRSSDSDRELLINLENKGIQSFEDANNLDYLQYKIINSDIEEPSV